MKKIDEALVLHEGWEMDNLAWVVENSDGTRGLRSTCHGRECVMGMDELEEKIAEAELSLAGLKRLRALVS